MFTHIFQETESSDGSSIGWNSNYSDEEVVMLASQNPKRCTGRKKFKETRHPVYRGIRRRDGGKWVCEVREPNKTSRIWLGTFPTAEMAARAHDVAVISLKGKSACLNFADSVWRLPVPATASAKDIKKAAAEAAQIFRPTEFESSLECMGRSYENLIDQESVGKLSEDGFYIDEELVFMMPGLLVSMAEGLMVPPPSPPPLQWVEDEDGFIGDEVRLWSY